MGWLDDILKNEEHQAFLRHNITSSGRNELISRLYSKSIFTDADTQTIQNRSKNASEVDQNDIMWAILRTRQNEITEKEFKDILTKAEQGHIVLQICGKNATIDGQIAKLEGQKFQDQGSISSKPKVEYFPSDAEMRDPGPSQRQQTFQLANQFNGDYDMLHAKLKKYRPTNIYGKLDTCGIALIINITKFTYDPQKNRDGAMNDTKELKEILEAKKYTVRDYDNDKEPRNLNKAHITQIIEDFLKEVEKGDFDSCIVSIMSHGSGWMSHDSFTSSDGHPISAMNKIELFNNDKCLKLISKPKIFLLDFCRGEEGKALFSKVEIPKQEPQFTGDCIKIGDPIPKWSDVLICFATMENESSWNNYNIPGYTNGNVFTQMFCQVLKNKPKLEIRKIIHMVCEILLLNSFGLKGTIYKQVCTYKNIGFTKGFYFYDK